MSTCTCTCACACACACACVHVHVACACACISCIHASVGRGVGACRWVDGCTRLFLTLTACFIQWVLPLLLTYLLTYLSFSGSYLLLTYLLTYLVSNYLLTTTQGGCSTPGSPRRRAGGQTPRSSPRTATPFRTGVQRRPPGLPPCHQPVHSAVPPHPSRSAGAPPRHRLIV